MLRNPKRLYIGLNCFMALCILLSWAAIYLLETTALVPLGLCPVLVLAGGLSSMGGLIACVLIVLALYGWMFFSLWGVSRRKRYGTVGVVVLLTLDLAANVIFTATSWWYLVATGLDLLVLLLSYRLYRLAGRTE